jgi:hypothetical protein
LIVFLFAGAYTARAKQKNTTRAEGKMVQVHIISIFSVMVGIGRVMHLSRTRGLASGEIRETMEAIHYHIITTLFWDWTGVEQHHILCFFIICLSLLRKTGDFVFVMNIAFTIATL